jgi:hypothetical protein
LQAEIHNHKSKTAEILGKILFGFARNDVTEASFQLNDDVAREQANLI